jgi:hypothetical protein
MEREKRYWFPAKRYGWGWGFPITWQGWIVLAIYGISLLCGTHLLHPHRNSGLFIFYVAMCSALFIFVCWMKGEPPR